MKRGLLAVLSMFTFSCTSSIGDFKDLSSLTEVKKSDKNSFILKTALNVAKTLGYKPTTNVDFDFKCNSLTRGVNKGLLLQAVAIYEKGEKFDFNYFKALLSATPWIPISMEKKLGQKIVEEEFRRGEFLDRKSHKRLYSILDKEANIILEAVKKNFGKRLPYQFHFYIYDSTEKNAFSLPGGNIVVSKKLIKELLFEERWNRHKKGEISTKRRDFLRFTLAHEISHNLKRHHALKLQTLVLNAINDSYQARDFMPQYINDIRQILDLKSLIKQSNAKGLKKIESLRDNAESRIIVFLNLINLGLDRLWSNKKHTLEEYSNFEKEADACALRINSLIYSKSELEKALENFLSELPQVSYTSRLDYSSDVSSLASDVANNMRKLIKFYLNQNNCIHPSSFERESFLKHLYTEEYKD